jgi:hypothetical protein
MGGWKVSVTFLFVYFFGGNILLPGGDFSSLPDIPSMYRNCKANEDPDMDIPDFIFEHLLQVDGLFGADEQEPDEKPHQPFTFTHQLVQVNFVTEQPRIRVKAPTIEEKKHPVFFEQTYSSDYVSFVFRPPVV